METYFIQSENSPFFGLAYQVKPNNSIVTINYFHTNVNGVPSFSSFQRYRISGSNAFADFKRRVDLNTEIRWRVVDAPFVSCDFRRFLHDPQNYECYYIGFGFRTSVSAFKVGMNLNDNIGEVIGASEDARERWLAARVDPEPIFDSNGSEQSLYKFRYFRRAQ